jgi:sporulation protein YlmC with PRC-barrel domain
VDITLGMHVYTSDDKDLGTVDRLILDPDHSAVKAVVVRKGVILHKDIEVSADMIMARPAGDARIAYTAEEVDRLPDFKEADYTSPPADYRLPLAYPASAFYWPIGYGMGVPAGGRQFTAGELQPAASPVAPTWTGDSTTDREVHAALQRQDLENAVIGEGSDVLGRDGEKVGTVSELTFDPADNQLTGLVVHKGLFKGEEWELPVSEIDSVDDGVVYLKVDAREAVR